MDFDDKFIGHQLIHREASLRDRRKRFVEKADAGEYFSKLVASSHHDSFSRLSTQWKEHSTQWKEHRRTYTRDRLNEKLQQFHCTFTGTTASSLFWHLYCYETSLQSLTQQLDAIIKSAESIKPNAATTIFCWWRRRQLKCYFRQQQVRRIAANTIFCWWRRRQLNNYFRPHKYARVIQNCLRRHFHKVRRVKTTHAATTIQVWRRYIVKRRKQIKLAAAELSHSFRDRGKPLSQQSKIGRRTRYRRKKRAEAQRHSTRSRPSRQRGLPRVRPPHNNRQQPTQPVDNKGSVLSNALHSRRELSRRGNVSGQEALHNQLELSSRGNVSGKALHNHSGSSSSSGIAVHNDSSTRRTSRRRRRRRKKCNASGLLKHGAVSVRDVFRLQLQQAAPGDRTILINLLFEVLKEAVDSLSITNTSHHHLPDELMHHPSSNQQSSHSSPSSKSDESPSLSVTVDCPSSSTHVELPTLPTQTGPPPSISSPEDLQSHSSSTLVENPSPPSTTVLVDLPLSSTTITEETSTRRKQPTTYLQALIGTTT